ncbi:aromatic ring-hydroxylating dioxygenase subunit alpha [uncultured Methylobacterium sp.]|uniref:aromatic ring-hydroxylating dioxygenase subunit alpha n=1 Tax=uncultured Methylobacterium sp. TaxID=157278 RepID=UPI0035CB78DE
MRAAPLPDPVTRDLWHPIAAIGDLRPGVAAATLLLDRPVSYAVDADGSAAAWEARADLPAGGPVTASAVAPALPTRVAYGYLWTCLGTPAAALFPIPEYAEPDRRNVAAASIGVNVSAPRAIENFLDMGHFPYVHTGILGAEPHTEVKEYDVAIAQDRDEILATRCRFFQPMSSTVAEGGMEVEYVYRVPHPFCSVLYKSSALDPARMDVIALFVQPMGQERVRAHMMLSLLDDRNDDTVIRRFQLMIFGQDKPILENQFPKRLPLDPRAETPIRADKSAIAYRRWLAAKGITYGTIPAAA